MPRPSPRGSEPASRRSLARSIARCHGMIRCVAGDVDLGDGRDAPWNSSSSAISTSADDAAVADHARLPRTDATGNPDSGLSPTMIVCPALARPGGAQATSMFRERSTILPPCPTARPRCIAGTFRGVPRRGQAAGAVTARASAIDPRASCRAGGCCGPLTRSELRHSWFVVTITCCHSLALVDEVVDRSRAQPTSPRRRGRRGRRRRSRSVSAEVRRRRSSREGRSATRAR